MEATRAAQASTGSGSRRSSAPTALARSQAWIRWSANSCDTYSRAGVGPLDRSTIRSRAPSACTARTASSDASSPGPGGRADDPLEAPVALPRPDALLRRLLPGRFGPLAEQVALVAVAHLGDGA